MSANSNSQNTSLSQHIVYICSRLIAYGLPLLFFLILSSFYLKTYDSAQIKITFTQVGGVTLAVIWLLKMLAGGGWPFTRKDLVYVAPFFAFLLSGVIVWLHTPFKEWSLEETLRRVFYSLFALLAIAEFQTAERMSRLWRWLLLTAWVVLGYGLLQFIDWRFFRPPSIGIDPFIWRGAFGPRVFSTFGNPNFYGNFLVICVPLALASILRAKGSIGRPFLLIALTLGLVVTIDKMTLGLFGGFDPSMQIVAAVLILAFLMTLFYFAAWSTGAGSAVSLHLMLFVILFINLYSTETKGAWVGFIAAIAATSWLVFEYFLHFEDHEVDVKKYSVFLVGLLAAYAALFFAMFYAFVLPWLKGSTAQVGVQILWIPPLFASVVATLAYLWLLKKPWNLKKIVYGLLLFFVIAMGAGVLQFAKKRLVSVSFRMFTWISTWEMVRTNPVLGNGVGTFKVIYPAFRRPQIIALEGRSNTETDHAEDEYLEVWQDEGIVGFGIFLWMVFTALILGLKQLRWYSRSRLAESGRNKKLFDLENDPRSYEVLGYLGAYIGALIHWCFDVSIRFVSSGIFSGLLPGVLVAYSRNHAQGMKPEVLMSYDRWIRVLWAVYWTVILCLLRVELVPQSLIQSGYTSPAQIYTWCCLAGIFIFVLLEFVDWTKYDAPVVVDAALPATVSSFAWVRWLVAPLVLLLLVVGVRFGFNQFWGDTHHNLAIFFSKEAIWMKSPAFDSKVLNFPQDIRDKYNNVGGALDHYKRVVTLNHAFPMAHYFTGNVYNDWGSQVFSESMAARSRNDMIEAERLKLKAQDMWDKAEEAYTATKKLAPNYVQTHHQVGLLDIKRAELFNQWGEPEKAQSWYQRAYENFELYRMLDPVFGPNYDRLVQLLLMQGKVAESIELYKQAIYYNFDVVYSIHYHYNADRAPLAISLAKLYFNQVNGRPNPFSPPAPEILEAIRYFKLATEADPANVEAWKGLGFLYEKTGQHQLSQQAYETALKYAPNDPDLKRK